MRIGQIRELAQEGKTFDQIMEVIVKERGIFGKYYFGHKSTESDRRYINSNRQRVLKILNPKR